MTPPPWWEGLAPVETDGPDGAEGHRLVWRDGALHLLAHPDPDAELALGALGGDRCPCLDVLDAWTAHHRTGSILVVGARHHDEVLAAPAAAIAALAGDLARWRGARAALQADARVAQDGDVLDRLSSLRSTDEVAAQRRLDGLLCLHLDRRLQHRLQASVAAALAASAVDPPAGASGASAKLTAATAARALPVLQQRFGWSGGLADIHLGPTPELTSTRAALPPSWVASVWGRGLTTTPDGGHLVLDVTSVTPAGAVVLAQAPGKPQVVIRVVQWENV